MTCAASVLIDMTVGCAAGKVEKQQQALLKEAEKQQVPAAAPWLTRASTFQVDTVAPRCKRWADAAVSVLHHGTLIWEQVSTIETSRCSG